MEAVPMGEMTTFDMLVDLHVLFDVDDDENSFCDNF